MCKSRFPEALTWFNQKTGLDPGIEKFPLLELDPTSVSMRYGFKRDAYRRAKVRNLYLISRELTRDRCYFF